MIRFRYNKLTGSYRTSLDLQKNDKDFVSIKFDTGASDTIITTSALGLDSIQTEILRKGVQTSKLKGTIFTSASGNQFIGYPCYCDDLKIGDVQIRRFYYYIVFSDMPKALLGDNFISCCTFTHSFKSDIIVTSFHSEEYHRQCENIIKNMDVFEMLFCSEENVQKNI